MLLKACIHNFLCSAGLVLLWWPSLELVLLVGAMVVEQRTSQSFRQLHAPAHTSRGWYQGVVRDSTRVRIWPGSLKFHIQLSDCTTSCSLPVSLVHCCLSSFSAYLQHTRTWCGC
ncbi:unnamed protein product, partial [Ectocarpus sp. 12 AP-2014]